MNKAVLLSPDFEPEAGDIVRFQLENGLTVVMMKSAVVPVVAVDVWYKVGSRNEKPGKSGFAHLFEHMMFQGSENVGKTEHMKLVNEVGGWMNGSTSKDRTNYFEVVPANQLRLALWLEADRMRSLELTEANFENQRDTVKEERRLRVDNAPYAAVLYEKLDELVYENWAYQHSVIGSMEDLDNATLEDVRKFHELYYRPNNAVLAVVGDIQVLKALELVKEYFGDIPRGEVPPPVDLTEPQQTGEKRMEWTDKFAPMPAYVCAYHIPERGSREHYVFEIMEKILFDGESSRLYRRFVEEEQSLVHIYGGVDSKIGPSTLMFFGQVKPGHTIPEVEKSFREEMKRLQEESVGERELQKAKNQFKAEFITKLERVYYKADLLCLYTAFFDDPGLLYCELEQYMTVTAEDIRSVAQKYLSESNCSVIEVHPAKSEGSEAAGYRKA